MSLAGSQPMRRAGKRQLRLLASALKRAFEAQWRSSTALRLRRRPLLPASLIASKSHRTMSLGGRLQRLWRWCYSLGSSARQRQRVLAVRAPMQSGQACRLQFVAVRSSQRHTRLPAPSKLHSSPPAHASHREWPCHQAPSCRAWPSRACGSSHTQMRNNHPTAMPCVASLHCAAKPTCCSRATPLDIRPPITPTRPAERSIGPPQPPRRAPLPHQSPRRCSARKPSARRARKVGAPRRRLNQSRLQVVRSPGLRAGYSTSPASSACRNRCLVSV